MSKIRKSFFKDGIDVREFIILGSVLNITIFFFIEFYFTYKIINVIGPEGTITNMALLIEFLNKLAIYVIMPHLIIVLFYFLNDRMADLAKVAIAKHSLGNPLDILSPNKSQEILNESITQVEEVTENGQ